MSSSSPAHHIRSTPKPTTQPTQQQQQPSSSSISHHPTPHHQHHHHQYHHPQQQHHQHQQQQASDLNLNMMLHLPRHHSPFQPHQQAFPPNNPQHRFSMQPSHSSPSFQTFVPRHPHRETLHSHHPTPPRSSSSNTNSHHHHHHHHHHRQSRHMEVPLRRNNEPANLIQSFPDAPQTRSRPNSVQVDARRVVTGVLQSALPPSSRPPPVNNAPVRSMSIAQLESRHKAALQKLQTHSNQHVVSSATLRPTPSSAKPSATKPPSNAVPPVSNLERHHRHKVAMQKLQAHSAPSQPPHPSSKVAAPATATNKPKPPPSVSDASSKSAKQPEEVPSSSNSTIKANPSHRRSLFGFSWSLKDSSKSSAPAAQEASASKSKSGKKQKASTTPSQVPEKEQEGQQNDVKEEEEEDEDVPLAQLASRRSSYQASAPAPTEGYFSRSHSLPGQMYQVNSQPTTTGARSGKSPMDAGPSRSRRMSTRPQRESAPPGIHAIREAANENIPAGFQPPPWLDNAASHAPGTVGPRPLIFEDEAKAIRNSKRLWS